MQYGKSVDGFLSARERLTLAQFGGLEGLEPRLLLSATPKLRVKNATVLEGDAGQFNSMNFVVVRKGGAEALSGVTRVNYTTALTGAINAAIQGQDFLGKQGVVKFKPGQKRKSINVSVVGNNTVEADRSFAVNLVKAKNAQIKRKTGFGIINDDDASGIQSQTPTVKISDVSQDEGNAGTKTFTFNVTLSNAHDKTVTVDYVTSNGTAKAADNDYEPANGTLTFNPGETSKTVSVTVNGDTQAELDETFIVNLSKATNAIITDAAGVGTILNDDGVPSLRISDVTVTEGSNGQITKAIVKVTLNGALDEELTVNYATADGGAVGGAVAGQDYTAASGTLTFEPGETEKTIEIDILGDNTVEGEEAFFVNLTNPSLDADVVVVTDNNGKVTITDDDVAPTVSINNVTKTEGDAGSTAFTFTLTLNKAATETATVDFEVADGTALETDNDYTATTGTVTFNPGEKTKTITVNVTGDTKLEGNETFFVNLLNPQQLAIADGQGQGTITNDDAGSTITISTPDPVIEGDAGTKNMVFNVTLSAASGLPVTVQFQTVNGTAKAGEDYVAQSGTLTFAPGELTKQIVVPIVGDFNPAEQLNELFTVQLSNATNALILQNQAFGTITDNDVRPDINVSNAQGFSGTTPTNNEEDGGQKAFRFTITLSQAVNQPVQVSYTTANGTATTADGDYVAKSGTVTIPAGQTTAEVNVLVNGDTKPEENEIFFLNLTSAKLVNANADISSFIVDSQGVATIVDDDGLPFITINDVTKAEGNNGTTIFSFTVSLSEATSRTVKVNYTTADGDDVTGTPDPTPPANVFDQDYVAQSGTLIFNPGQTSKTINIVVNGDTNFEPQEVFSVLLSNPDQATIQDSRGIGYIVNDDAPVEISVNDVAVTEGDAGTKTLTFTVSLNKASNQAITVDYATQDGTAQNEGGDNDYLAKTGTLIFNPGQLSKTVSVTINGDVNVEPDEFFNLLLSNAVNAVIVDDTGLGEISNDD